VRPSVGHGPGSEQEKTGSSLALSLPADLLRQSLGCLASCRGLRRRVLGLPPWRVAAARPLWMPLPLCLFRLSSLLSSLRRPLTHALLFQPLVFSKFPPPPPPPPPSAVGNPPIMRDALPGPDPPLGVGWRNRPQRQSQAATFTVERRHLVEIAPPCAAPRPEPGTCRAPISPLFLGPPPFFDFRPPCCPT